MADEHYRWLDRDAAERLLNGEPLEDVDADTRAEADRLARALSALAAEPALNSAELPGEAAALAAFRKVRVGQQGQQGQEGYDGNGVQLGRGKSRGHVADAGLVRLGRPAQGGRRARWGRPARFGLAAALAAGMIGGVAVAAGTGVLPPFGDDRPGPAASVTAGVTPDRPLVSPSPSGGQRGGLLAPTPDGTTNGPSGGTSSHDTARNGDASARPGSDSGGHSGAGRAGHGAGGLLSSCRDLRDGKALETGRRRDLEDAAGGGTRVKQYCEGVLDSGDYGKGEAGKGSGKGSNGGSGGGSGKGDQDDQGDDDGHHIGQDGKGNGHGHGGSGGSGHGGKGHQSSDSRQSSDGRQSNDGRRGNGGAAAQVHPSPSPTPSYSAL